MTPRILEGDNAKYIFFPEEADTILNRTAYATVYVGANADTKEKVDRTIRIATPLHTFHRCLHTHHLDIRFQDSLVTNHPDHFVNNSS
ncbi:MAG: hypothetical protein II815_03495, partial [Bacteroidales bacterium]|nr:hypothetical protein [Bacteroidales bacterium]